MKASIEKKIKMQEHLKVNHQLFKRLRVIYERVNEDCSGMDYTPIEVIIVFFRNLPPYV